MKKLFVSDFETLVKFTEVENVEEGLERIREYENQDRIDNYYTEGFYCISNSEYVIAHPTKIYTLWVMYEDVDERVPGVIFDSYTKAVNKAKEVYANKRNPVEIRWNECIDDNGYYSYDFVTVDGKEE